MSKKMQLEINKENFSELLNKMSELSIISDIIKIKISPEKIFIYSIKGESAILAFKSYTIDTNKIFNTSIPEPIEMIVSSGSKFIKSSNLYSLSQDSPNLVFSITYKEKQDEQEYGSIRSAQLSDGKFKFSVVIAEPLKIRDISEKMLNKILEPSQIKWCFDIDNNDLKNIKNMAGIYDGDVLTISTLNNNVVVSQSNYWSLNVDTIEESCDSLSFDKNYLKLIKINSDNIKFSIYERFMYFSEENMNLIIAIEITY